MASPLSALPTITATALGASLATGIAAGQYKAPTAVVGYMVPMDSVNFYIQHADSPFQINVTATATSTQNGNVQTITQQKGVNIFVNIVSVAATTTLGINFQSSDPSTATFVTVARASIDGIQTGTTGEALLQIYPGLPVQTSLAIGGVAGQANAHIGHMYRVQASVTATASAGGAGLTFQVHVNNLL